MKKSQATERYINLKQEWIKHQDDDKYISYLEKEMEKVSKKISKKQFEFFLEEDECMSYEEFVM